MGSTRGQLVFVGAATMDSIALVPHFPGADQRVMVDELVRAGGGPAATAAVAAARAGCSVSLVTMIGDDREGEEILDSLADEQIDLSGVIRTPSARSASSLVIVARDRATRALCSQPGPILNSDAEQALRRAVVGADWVHCDHHGWPLVSRLWPTLSRPPRLSLDDGHFLGDLDPAILNLYVPTLAVLQQRSGTGEVAGALRWALERGVEAVVATDGSAGCHGQSRTDAPFTVPAAPCNLVSTLGAGDVFHGALVAALSREVDLPTAVAQAAATAAASCEALDGRTAIPRISATGSSAEPRGSSPARPTASRPQEEL